MNAPGKTPVICAILPLLAGCGLLGPGKDESCTMIGHELESLKITFSKPSDLNTETYLIKSRTHQIGSSSGIIELYGEKAGDEVHNEARNLIFALGDLKDAVFTPGTAVSDTRVFNNYQTRANRLAEVCEIDRPFA